MRVVSLCSFWLAVGLLLPSKFAWVASAPARQVAALVSQPRVIVRYGDFFPGSSEVTTRQQAGALWQHGGVENVKVLAHVGMAVVSLSSQSDVERLMASLAGDDAVELVVPDTHVHAYGDGFLDDISIRNETDGNDTVDVVATSTSTTSTAAPRPLRKPNDPYYRYEWGLNETAGINCPGAWDKFVGAASSDAEIIVGVIDTGIDYLHEDLRGQMWINRGEIPGNGIDDDGNGYIDDVHGANFVDGTGDPMDDNVHGTHCSGTIAAAGNNNVGVAGVAWKGVKLMALKFLDRDGQGKISDAISAINYAVAHGARITSNSWGGGGSNSALRVAIERAEETGVLFITAAGNEAQDNDDIPNFPANYRASNVISVASTQSNGALSPFSCYGSRSVHVAAPGSNILSSTPNNSYKYLSGTSMATPHVSGLAALIWMYRPHLTAQQVKEIVLSSAIRIDALRGKTKTGAMINAAGALQAADAGVFVPPRPPTHAPQQVSFEDTDPVQNELGGTITIRAAIDESDIEYYKVYFVSSGGFPIEVVGEVNATGATILNISISNMTMLKYTTGLVAVSGNASGELQPWSGGVGANAEVVDYVQPLFSPRGASWSGDTDARPGFVSGELEIIRAEDETTLTHYNIRWLDDDALVGTIAAIDYRAPSCISQTFKNVCMVINQTELSDGYRFTHNNYGNSEQIAISFSGPARATVTSFNTEKYYDYLKIGSRTFSGEKAVPFEIDLPAGEQTISWYSDWSESGGGWSFDIQGPGIESSSSFSMSDVKKQSNQVVVKSANGDFEREQGVVVDLDELVVAPGASLRGSVQMAAKPGHTARAEDFDSRVKPQARPGQAVRIEHYDDLQGSWLQRVSERTPQDVALKKIPARASGRIRSRVTIDGLVSSHVALLSSMRRRVHEAVERAITMALDDSKRKLVEVKVLDSSLDAVPLVGLTFEFEVAPSATAPSAGSRLLDSVEAQLLLLKAKGPACQRFDKSLAAELVAALPSDSMEKGVRSNFDEVSQREDNGILSEGSVQAPEMH